MKHASMLVLLAFVGLFSLSRASVPAPLSSWEPPPREDFCPPVFWCDTAHCPDPPPDYYPCIERCFEALEDQQEQNAETICALYDLKHSEWDLCMLNALQAEADCLAGGGIAELCEAMRSAFEQLCETQGQKDFAAVQATFDAMESNACASYWDCTVACCRGGNAARPSTTITGYVSRINYGPGGEITQFVLACDDGALETFGWSTSYPTSWARIIEDSLDPPQDDIDVTYADDGSTIEDVQKVEAACGPRVGLVPSSVERVQEAPCSEP